MTVAVPREARQTSIDRMLVRLGLAMVRYGRARAARRERALRRSRASTEAMHRRDADERRLIELLGARR